MTRNFFLCFFLTALLSVGGKKAFAQTTETGPVAYRFPTKGNKEVTILQKINVNADTLRTLLVVSNDTMWVEIGRKLNYFKEVMTMAQLQKEIIHKGLTDKIPGISDRIGLYNACVHFKPFVILIPSGEDLKSKGFRSRLSLYDPLRSETIFNNEVRLNLMWEGYSKEKILYPLLNSLAGYLEEQK